MVTIYAIVKRNKRESWHNGFQDEAELKKFITDAKQLYPDSKIYLVEHLHPLPIDPTKPKPQIKGTVLWCPYCGEWRRFNKDRKTSKVTQYCTICRMSTKDFGLKTSNDIWPKALNGMTEDGKKVIPKKGGKKK